MDIIWKKTDGYQSEEPGALDITSSDVYVYLRRNIQPHTKVDPMSGEEIDFWRYEEAKITKKEYEQYSDTLIYQALATQSQLMDEANAMVMLSQSNIEATQADQDETIALILENTTTAEEV